MNSHDRILKRYKQTKRCPLGRIINFNSAYECCHEIIINILKVLSIIFNIELLLIFYSLNNIIKCLSMSLNIKFLSIITLSKIYTIKFLTNYFQIFPLIPGPRKRRCRPCCCQLNWFLRGFGCRIHPHPLQSIRKTHHWLPCPSPETKSQILCE